MKIRPSEEAIDAVVATGDCVERKLIVFDQVKGVITKVLSESAADYNSLKKSAQETDSLKIYPDHILLFAAFGDIHIHAREDVSGLHVYKEDFESVRNAAYQGGVVFACDMPNNPVAPIDDESYLAKYKLSLKNSFALLPYAGIGPHTKPLSFLVPYKAYMGHSVGDLFFVDNESLGQSIKNYVGQYVSFHCEDPIVLENNKNKNSHFLRRPIEAEILATQTAIELARAYKLKAKLCHYSSGEGLELIKKAKSEGVELTCEVTPQHLYFNEEEILLLENDDARTEFQMNPPIRNRYNRDLLLKALASGNIDYLATDHAPHSPEEKKKGMSGLTGLDTYGAFVTWLLVTKKIDAKIIAKVCSENPGEFYNKFHDAWIKGSAYEKAKGLGLGFIKEGYSASFTLLNLQLSTTITRAMLKTKAQSSPFLGVTFPGSVHRVYFNGERVGRI